MGRQSNLDLIIIGAGPGGIAPAAEAFASGIDPSQILILEKGPTHNSAIRQLYPEQKLTTANYKGFAARCEGLLCLGDMTKSEILASVQIRTRPPFLLANPHTWKPSTNELPILVQAIFGLAISL